MAVLPDGRVLHTQRAGALRLTTPASGVTEVVNQFNVYTAGEQGLLTVALDPDFATNQWVYVYYAPRLDTPGGNAPGTLPAGQTEAYWDQWKGYDVLSRFKWTGNSLDMASEQQIIKIETNRGGSAHHAGDIAWDAQGNLFLSVGDNTSAQAGNAQGYAPINDSPGLNPAFDARRGAGNTNDLRGKILRIKVAADGSYTVPAGNLFPAGPKTRPEIYIMGLRNPYRMDIDKATNTLVWGEYAPDAGRDDARRGPMGLVEWNASPASGAPHNQGWPYCIADNRPYNNWDFVNGVSREWFDCNAPKNTSQYNTGLVDLPPVVPADMWYGDKNCKTTAPEDCDNPLWPELQRWSDNIEQAPMAGPVYNYDAANPVDDQVPCVLGRQGVLRRVFAGLPRGVHADQARRPGDQARAVPAQLRARRPRRAPVGWSDGPGVRQRRLALRPRVRDQGAFARRLQPWQQAAAGSHRDRSPLRRRRSARGPVRRDRVV